MHFSDYVLPALSLCTLTSAANPKRGMISDLNPSTYKADSDVFTSKSSSALSWYHSFGQFRDGKFSSKYEFVMQQFGVDEKPTPDGNDFKNLKTLAKSVERARPKYLMTFLEPINYGVSVDEAVRAWRKYIIPLKKKYPKMQIGSPQMINGDAARPWLKSFIKKCPECKFDFLDLHYYWTYQNFQGFIKGWHKDYPKYKVWVSDIGFQSFPKSGPQCKAADKLCVAKTMDQIRWMDRTDWIVRYTYRGEFRRGAGGRAASEEAMPGWSFLDGNGKVTALGKFYLQGKGQQ